MNLKQPQCGDIESLIELAMNARKNSYSPYSNFPVGAAVQTADGSTFVGCNVENASFGLSFCAERSAISQAVSAGHRAFTTLVVVATPLASPCGACRQVIAEFGHSIEVISVDASDRSNRKQWTIDQLLPDGFQIQT